MLEGYFNVPKKENGIGQTTYTMFYLRMSSAISVATSVIALPFTETS